MGTILTRLHNIEQRLTRSQAESLLTYLSPSIFARERLLFALDDWQARVLDGEGRRVLLNCARQSGKSLVSAIKALHQSLFFPGSLTLLISPSQRQSGELFRRVTDLLTLLPTRPILTEESKLSLRLTNGSRVVSLPSSEPTIRGFSGASLIVEDESARVDDTVFFSTKPMLATSGGTHLLMSTPAGKRGHFFELWDSGDPTWQRIHVTAYECPRISAEFLAQEQATMPKAWFDAEYLGIFNETVDAVFSYADVMNAVSDEIPPLFAASPLPSGVVDHKVSVLSFGGTH